MLVDKLDVARIIVNDHVKDAQKHADQHSEESEAADAR